MSEIMANDIIIEYTSAKISASSGDAAYKQTTNKKSLFSYLNGTKCLQKSVQISYYIQ